MWDSNKGLLLLLLRLSAGIQFPSFSYLQAPTSAQPTPSSLSFLLQMFTENLAAEGMGRNRGEQGDHFHGDDLTLEMHPQLNEVTSRCGRCCRGSEQRSPPLRRGEGWAPGRTVRGGDVRSGGRAGKVPLEFLSACVCTCVHIRKYCTLSLNHSPTILIAARSLNQTQSSPVWLMSLASLLKGPPPSAF